MTQGLMSSYSERIFKNANFYLSEMPSCESILANARRKVTESICKSSDGRARTAKQRERHTFGAFLNAERQTKSIFGNETRSGVIHI